MFSDKKVFVYDTTLRDGSQGEGVSFTVAAKLRLAEKLDAFQVDYIEGGWPGSNPRDREFFEQVKKYEFKHAKLAAFGSTRRANTPVEQDKQVAQLVESGAPVVTVFGKSWLLHVTEVLRTSPEENLAMIEDTVHYLKSLGREVVYDAEHFFDGYKDDPEYALMTLSAAAAGGADFLVLCDTNGGTLLPQLIATVKEVKTRFPEHKLGVHCHNDSGVGVALSLAGVGYGAVMVQGTLNGYGERNGNANLTSIIPNLALKMGYELSCAKNLAKLRDLSLFCDELVNRRSNPSEPFVGASSFAHKGGVHANAVEKVRHSYEHIDPALVGNRTRVLVSDMAGRSLIMMKAAELGLKLDEKSPDMANFIERLKTLENAGYEYEAADASFKLLVERMLKKRADKIEVVDYHVYIGHDHTQSACEAVVKLKLKGKTYHTVGESTGPVGALDAAMRKALEKAYPFIKEMKLLDFKVRILEGNRGAAAVTRVMIESTDGKRIWGTVGASDNIIVASWEALKDAFEYAILLNEQA